jgi:glycosyltransferase involved in cell wall biosynthesis
MKLSIVCITYNHEKFITRAIEGFLAQKTNFPFEIIIGDDHSNDQTLSLCSAYSESHENIKILSSEANRGMIYNLMRCFKACTGKYIAICEGDDYWVDPYKLQKQVDVLDQEKYANVFAVCTNACTVDENENMLSAEMNVVPPSNKEGIYNLHDFFSNKHHYPTLTVVFRNQNIDWINQELERMKNPFLGDWILWVLLHLKGPFYFLKQVTGAYRINQNSVTHTADVINRWRADFKIRKQLLDILPIDYHHYIKNNWNAYFKLSLEYRKRRDFQNFIKYQALSLLSSPNRYFRRMADITRNK